MLSQYCFSSIWSQATFWKRKIGRKTWRSTPTSSCASPQFWISYCPPTSIQAAWQTQLRCWKKFRARIRCGKASRSWWLLLLVQRASNHRCSPPCPSVTRRKWNCAFWRSPNRIVRSLPSSWQSSSASTGLTGCARLPPTFWVGENFWPNLYFYLK